MHTISSFVVVIGAVDLLSVGSGSLCCPWRLTWRVLVPPWVHGLDYSIRALTYINAVHGVRTSIATISPVFNEYDY